MKCRFTKRVNSKFIFISVIVVILIRNMTETTKHLLRECIHVKIIWRLFNDLMNCTENVQECVNNYENVFQTCELLAISIVKAKIIQALIQIERPMNWNREKLLDTIKYLITVEQYNAVVSRTINKFNLIWNIFDNLN